jgi:hypothetical protein
MTEVIFLAQQKNCDVGYVVGASCGRYGTNKLIKYPGYLVKYTNFDQAAKVYEKACAGKVAKAYEKACAGKETLKKHGNSIATFFTSNKKAAAVFHALD